MARKGEGPQGIPRYRAVFARTDPTQIQTTGTVRSFGILESLALYRSLFLFNCKLVQEVGYSTHRIFAHC